MQHYRQISNMYCRTVDTALVVYAKTFIVGRNLYLILIKF